MFLAWTWDLRRDAELIGWFVGAGRARRDHPGGGTPGDPCGREGWAFVGTAVTIGLATAALFTALFPEVMPSTTDPAYSLTTTNASSTRQTLRLMSWVAVVCTPFVLGYQTWTYIVFRRRIGVRNIPRELMRPIDPRLLRHALAARRHVVVCAVLGVLTAVLVLAQAELLADGIAAVVDDGVGRSGSPGCSSSCSP